MEWRSDDDLDDEERRREREEWLAGERAGRRDAALFILAQLAQEQRERERAVERARRPAELDDPDRK